MNISPDYIMVVTLISSIYFLLAAILQTTSNALSFVLYRLIPAALGIALLAISFAQWID